MSISIFVFPGLVLAVGTTSGTLRRLVKAGSQLATGGNFAVHAIATFATIGIEKAK
ncbi:hypothetical protein [Bradyrhizobium australiense]|uniref:Uncharacterized protein n=1 Tax=Bradyrhizobium australiense TaxID=2721161 RepID=A0A7Y4GRV6_9BRAD|nr:hypothetical protein [Bradyrhizobium australiense]NOJ40839.1 hypothetical protein [Bradyrhizobium australiense]